MKRAHERPPELASLRIESELERTTREMFARWGEWRLARPEDQPRAKAAIDDAELAYDRARERILAAMDLSAPPDYDRLRETVRTLTRTLARNDIPPSDVVTLLEGRHVRDLSGDPISGLAMVSWTHARPERGHDVLELRDKDGREIARITHVMHSPAPRWTCAVWNDTTGDLEWPG